MSAFQVQPNYTYGNSGRNILFGPSQTNLDFSLAKAFRLSERFRLQFRAEAFNASNTPGFGLPGREHQRRGCRADHQRRRAAARAVRPEAAVLSGEARARPPAPGGKLKPGAV